MARDPDSREPRSAGPASGREPDREGDGDADLRREIERLRGEVERHRQTATRLTATESTMRAVLELTDAAVFAKDLDGRYLLVNRRGAEIVGLVPDDIVGRTDADLYRPEQAARFRDHDLAVIASREPNTTMMPIPRPDGEELWLSHLVPLLDEHGEVTGTAGIATDITERARHEILLQQRTQQLVTAQRIARLGSWSWNLATDAIEISDELGRILGRPTHERWVITDLTTLTHPDDLAGAVEAVLEARDGAEVDHLFRIRRPDGEVRWLQLRSEAAGRDGIVVGTVQDVTQREVAEQQRQALEQQLERTRRLETVGQLAGGVAHDFNNLLAVLVMQADLALEATGPTHPAAGHLHDLRSTLDRAGALTHQLLVFSRHDDTERSVIDLGTVVARLVPLLDRSLGSHIDLQVELDPEIAPVRADASQIEQVVVNLAVNARDAMPHGGTLRITAANVDDRVRLTVADDGRGMSPDVVERAFEPFFTTKPAGLGTGLGLATVHGIVTRAGGTVDLTTTEGGGTTVRVELPASDEPATVDGIDTVDRAGTDGGATSTEPGSATVMIVEDLEPLGALAATMLRRAGYQTLLAVDGERALALADDHPFDLLLTDVVMPNMSGSELVTRLRARRPALPVVYMSGYTAGMLDLDDDDEAVVLAKPFTREQLLAAVAAGLAGVRHAAG